MKQFIIDLVTELLKFVVQLAIPVCMIAVGAVLIFLGDKFDVVVLFWAGLLVALLGVLRGVFLLFWYDGM